MTTEQIQQHLDNLGISSTAQGTAIGSQYFVSQNTINSYSPVDGVKIAEVSLTTDEHYEMLVEQAQDAFKMWRKVPAPKRGELVRLFGEKLRDKKQDLGCLLYTSPSPRDA